MKNRLYIGTSGWSYGDWKGIFYPEDVKSANRLQYYSGFFKAVEVNSTFYHMPRASTISNWALTVPQDFRFCVKMSRYLTHIKKLTDTGDSLSHFLGLLKPIKNILGPILIQLPSSVVFDSDTANNFFSALQKYPDFCFALEVRNESWLTEDALTLIDNYQICLVISQSGVGYPYIEHIATRDVYLRMHGPKELYASSYTQTELKAFAGKIKAWIKKSETVWVFFNNTMRGTAIDNINTLREYIG